jgi:hypothetical protein
MTPEKAKEMNVERALENGDKLAFPIHADFPYHNGLTKREYMATQLMAGLLAQGIGSDVAADCSVRAVENLLIAIHINSK